MPVSEDRRRDTVLSAQDFQMIPGLPSRLHRPFRTNSGLSESGSVPLRPESGGPQKNFVQSSGSNNRQFNADTIVFNDVKSVRRQEPLPPASFIPYPRDPDFVGRSEHDELHRKLATAGRRIALVGLGGAGKTQLALEYSYQLRDRSPATWVFWVHASNAVRFDEDIRRICKDVGVQNQDEKDEDPLEALSRWLRNPRNGQWLLVLDNADNADFLLESCSSAPTIDDDKNSPTRKPRWEHIPICLHGSVIVTSCYEGTVARLVDEEDTIRLVPDREHALKLLRRKMRNPKDERCLESLAETLCFVPLAITQAAAYMRKTRPRCTVEEYVAKLSTSVDGMFRIFSKPSNNVRRDIREAKDSIFLTWYVSFEHLARVRPSAVDMLSLMSYFDPHSIPWTLLSGDALSTRTLSEAASLHDGDGSCTAGFHAHVSTQDRLEEDLMILREFSFVADTPDDNTWSMHQLVQLATRSWLRERNTHIEWLTRSMQQVNRAFPEVDVQAWDICRDVYLHAKMAVNFRSDDLQVQAVRLSLLRKATTFALQQKYWHEVGMLAEEAYNASIGLYGPDTKIAVDCLADLASAKRQQDQHDEADQLTERVLLKTRKILGDCHSSTLVSMSNYAVVLIRQGKLDEAEELLLQTLEAKNRVLEPSHPSTCMTMTNLAHVLAEKGQEETAEELFWEAIQGLRSQLGSEDPKTLDCMIPLASLLRKQGRFEEAEALHTWVAQTRRRVFGLDHLDTVAAELELGVTILHKEGDADVECYV